MEEPKLISIPQAEWDKMQEQLKMLTEVADKGRILSYQTKNANNKKPVTVKVSIYDDKYIIGWKTLKFELGRNPQTGKAIWGGETAEYEVKLMDKEGAESTEILRGYSAFSDAKYDNRIECAILSKKETAEGELLFEVALPNNKTVLLESKFLN